MRINHSFLLFSDIVSKYQYVKVGCMKNANFERDVYIMKYKDIVGVLDRTIPDCGIIIPTKAYKETFKEILKEYNFDFREGATWITDAFYRETRDKVNYYKIKVVFV